MTPLQNGIDKIREGLVLTDEDMDAAIRSLMTEGADEGQAEAFLTALAARGETASEITAAARTLRSLASTIDAPPGTIDCCGTGGDGLHTYNVSTAVALVSAACGARVAKHGNRSSSSKCGAADVLEKLGVPLVLPRAALEGALAEIGFCFLMAPAHHASMKNVAAIRRKIGRRTIFNLLGPLANPAGATKQLVGVYGRQWVRPMAEALSNLGAARALVVHGDDGLDEITLGGDTHAAFLTDGAVTDRILTPVSFGLPYRSAAEIRGGDADENARALLALLNGEKTAYRDVVLANTAAALHLHDGRAFQGGVSAAAAAIDSGAALNILERYRGLA